MDKALESLNILANAVQNLHLSLDGHKQLGNHVRIIYEQLISCRDCNKIKDNIDIDKDKDNN